MLKTEFTPAKAQKLRQAYTKAVAAGQTEFEVDLDGQQHGFHTRYAYYLLEYFVDIGLLPSDTKVQK